MIKLRGFGGKTEFWDYNLESFTLMAGLAAAFADHNLECERIAVGASLDLDHAGLEPLG